MALKMRLPWISREHHLEVVAAKDALIRSLEVQNAVLAERLAEPVAVTVQMPENFALLQPAIVKRRKESPAGPEPHKEAPEVDWANVDPENPFIMAELAAREFGRLLAPIELADWTARVRRQIKAAKEQGIRTPQIPQVGTLETKQVPAHIKDMIEKAEAV
jgi:hypothetical protein